MTNNTRLLPQLFAVGSLAIALIACSRPAPANSVTTEKSTEGREKETKNQARHVELSPEAENAAGVAVETVAERDVANVISVTGTVEVNLEKMQVATPLVEGRVDSVNVRVGDRVKEGDVLATISSPQIAELRGELREAETRLRQAQQNLERVQRAENRVALLQAKAHLDEAEASLRRTRRLIELGAAAGKDLNAAEAAFASAKANYDYQSNISLNREVQQARAEVETADVELSHLRGSLAAMGASEQPAGMISPLIPVTAPLAGTIIERLVNAGAGASVGMPMFKIADISVLWVIANIPDGQIHQLRIGTPAEIRSPELDPRVITGRIAYIDPVLTEDTRTGRARIEIANPGERLKVGMFVTTHFKISAATPSARSRSIAVPEAAVQRLGERTIVFVSGERKGHYEARDVQLGALLDGFHPVIAGLQAGERIVTAGSFTLKTQLLKGELGEN